MLIDNQTRHCIRLSKSLSLNLLFKKDEKGFPDEGLPDRSENPFFVGLSFEKLRMTKQKKIVTHSRIKCLVKFPRHTAPK